ncbi:hypothetical protein [Carboxydothermus pertinax]|uniref:Uncharacterized protein n=1 Tax=Carboxydothermus pertinax TaxID=870242 RepID=A0A1L8CV17_9THEO|nr:hypothetical protein [Carboxydothermus pertinax]GAV22766.1 hypothetical protein cpu_12760 [Carboxydothermus pertinax]
MQKATKILTLLMLLLFILGSIALASGSNSQDSMATNSSMSSGNMDMSSNNMDSNQQNTKSSEDMDMSNNSATDHQKAAIDNSPNKNMTDGHEVKDSHSSGDIPWSFLKVIGILNAGIILTGLIVRHLPKREELKNEPNS